MVVGGPVGVGAGHLQMLPVVAQCCQMRSAEHFEEASGD